MAPKLPCPTVSLMLLFIFSGEISIYVNGQPWYEKNAWCVASPMAEELMLQQGLDFALGQLKECRPIQEGGPCYEPNTIMHHASFAMNAFYQKEQAYDPQDTCGFGSTFLISATDPSYGSCKYEVVPGPPKPVFQLETSWCVAKPGTPDSVLQANIYFVCGGKVKRERCKEIQKDGPCYLPNTLINHASFVMNHFYKTDPSHKCDFNGTGLIFLQDPSQQHSRETCHYD